MVRFVRDFQSRHTGENFYAAGAKAELGSEAETALIAEGAAELVTIDSRVGQVEPKAPEPPAPAPVERGRPRKAVR